MTERRHILSVVLGLIVCGVVCPVFLIGQAAGAAADPLGEKGSQVDRLLAQIATYDYGASREPLTELTELERALGQEPAALRALEHKYLRFVESDASLAGKQFICRRLSIVGSEASAVTLARMLADPETADMARYALEMIPSAAVDEALREAIDAAGDKAKIGILSTLGLRGDPASVPVLARHVTHADPDVASAAITGLGQIGDAAAITALREAKDKTSGDLRMMVLDAYLSCADKLEMSGQVEEARQIYREVFESDVPTVIRSAALRGMVFCSEGQAGLILVDVIRKGDPQMTSVAVGLLNEIREDTQVEAIAAEVKNLPPTSQVQLLTALGHLGNKAATPAVMEATGSDHEDVRIAAYRALASLGDPAAVSLLARVAAATAGAEREAARDALYTMRAPGVDAAITEALAAAERIEQAPLRAELVRAIGERNIKSAVAPLLEAAADANGRVRTEAWKVLRHLAGPDQLGTMLDLLMGVESSTERTQAERAVSAVCGRLDPVQAVDRLVARLDGAPAAGRASLVTLLGQFGGSKAFGAVRAALDDPEAAVVDAAVRSLSEFPDALPTQTLFDLAHNAEGPVHRILALRGYIRMIGLTQAATGELVKMCQTAMALADRVPEKRLVLAAAARIPDAAAREFVANYTDDPQVRAEAEAAAAEIDKLLERVAVIGEEGLLVPAHAGISGAGARLDDEKMHIVGWDDANTTMQWDVVLDQAGQYEVVVVQAASEPADDPYTIAIGSAVVQGHVRDTKGQYEEVSVGTLRIDTPGVYTVVLRALDKTGDTIMDIGRIRLVRRTQIGSRVVLTGSDFSAWREDIGTWMIGGDATLDADDPTKLRCLPGNGVFVNGPDGRTVYLFTKAEFADCMAHIEFMVPQGSNSGVYFQGRYEIQIFDSYGVAGPKYSDCGGIYERWKDNQGYEGVPPRVNASLPPGQWQSFDVVFRAPRFDASGRKTANARFVKVVHNGKVVHEDVEVTGPTRAAQFEDEKPTGALVLQGDHGPVAYRNIWVAPVD